MLYKQPWLVICRFQPGQQIKFPTRDLDHPAFLGATLNYSQRWWGAWIQAGTTLTTTHHHTKFGNQFFYQGGLEYCFATRPGWIFAGLLDLFGTYEQKSRLHGIKDNDSGGNTFWIGPSIWASCKKTIIQVGVAAPAAQHLFGTQNKSNYFVEILLTYKF